MTSESWDITIKAGGWATDTFQIFDDAATNVCTLETSTSLANIITNLPSELNLSSNQTHAVNPYIVIPESPLTSYHGDIWYCRANIDVDITISGAVEEKSCIETVQVNWYGSRRPGSNLLFYVFNTTDKKGIKAFITVKSLETGNPEQSLECDGYCVPKYSISVTEQGQIVAEVSVPGCGDMEPLPITITGEVVTNETWTGTTGTKEISVTGYSEVNIGENFQFLIIGENKPLKYADASVVGPEAYSFSGTTDANGFVVDSAGKIFGKDTKPDKVGDYTLFIEREGFEATQFSFSIIRMECPHDCCPANGYESKECQSGFECVENECKEIEKPKLSISCEPSRPYQFDTSMCSLFKPDGSLYSDSMMGTLNYKGETNNIVFSNGKINLTFDDLGAFTLSVPDTADYEGSSYMETVVQKPIPSIDWMLIILIIVVIVVIIILVVAVRWALGKRGKGVFELERTEPSTVEKIVREK